MNCSVIDKVIEYISKARMLHSEVADELLMKDAADTSALPYTIYYMNGNDGTDFDFSCNGRTCEFMVFYKKSEMGFLKVSVNDDDTIDGYCYGEGQLKPFEDGGVLNKESLDAGDARIFAYQLQTIADDNTLWDMPISRLDFDSPFNDYGLEWFPDKEDDVDDELYDDDM